jgi:putative sensory transduction regulator
VSVEAAAPAQLAACEELIEEWLQRQLRENPAMVAVDRDPELRRWYARMRGEQRDFVAVWLTLGEYTLEYETYFMPGPEERVADCYEFLLRANRRLFGMGFAIGAEDAVYLVGRLPVSSIDADELDRIIGSAYEYVERYFRPAMRIGYGARFPG